MPFIYALSVYAAYERPFRQINRQTIVFRVRWQARIAIAMTLHFKTSDVIQFQHFWAKKLVDAKTFGAARAVVRQFEQSLRDDECTIAEEEYRLWRYAGVDGIDSEGRRLDRREFKETMKALRWLATCHMGHYRKRSRYDENLLSLLGDDFTMHGLTGRSRIEMKVAKTGQRWFAYRRTVSGWCFAIGAAGPPPDQWEYDGCDPPCGFPGEDPSWGNGSFGDREVKILMRLPDGRNVATRQAVHGSVPCARTEVTGRWLGTAADSPCLDDSSRGDSRRRTP